MRQTGILACTVAALCWSGCSDGDSKTPSGSAKQCGNGTIDDGEDCDGAALGDSTCQSLGFDGGLLDCDACRFDTNGCVGNVCGDGEIDAGEECDGEDLGGTTCTDLGFGTGSLACDGCAFLTTACGDPTCGDSKIAVGAEECDGTTLGDNTCQSLGFDGGLLTCNACAFDTSGCVSTVCGDGEIDTGEECDGAALGAATCASLGFDPGTLACGNCRFVTTECGTPVCGDTQVVGNEDCDGNDLNGATCQSRGFRAGQLTCAGCAFDTSQCVDEICGDGFVDGAEACDGTNLDGQDCFSAGYRSGVLGCADCQLETSQCLVSVCGDGFVDGAEECDGDDNLGTETCGSLGMVPTGILRCGTDCRYSTTLCVKCGDDICHPGERGFFCPEDCQPIDITAGAIHSCAVLADGSVRCWGARDGHRMGGTGDVNYSVRLPEFDGKPVTATHIAAGEAHTCIIRSNAEVWCWGRNHFGEVGGNLAAEVYPPRQVEGLPPVVAISAGRHHTCTIADVANGSRVWCWGRGDFGAIGHDAFEHRNRDPESAQDGTNAIAAGDHHTCALRGDEMSCWGSNERGQLASGDVLWLSKPKLVSGSGLEAIGSGAEHGCASIGDDLYCWGNNNHGQLGSAAGDDVLSMQKVADQGATMIAAGLDFTCTLPKVQLNPHMPQAVHCWGANSRGQLSDGTTDERAAPGLSFWNGPAVDLAAGDRHACSITTNHRVKCWGDNSYGQLGINRPQSHRIYAGLVYGF